MNAPVSTFLSSRPHPLASDARRGRIPVQAWIVPIADQAAFAMFDLPESGIGGRKAVPHGGSIDGAALPRPMISSLLPLRSGGLRHLLLLRMAGKTLAQSHVKLEFGTETAAVINPDWLQSPLRDLADIVDGLTEQGQQRLLKLFLTSATSLLGREQGHAFVHTARLLLDLLQVKHASLAARCPVGRAGQVLTYNLVGMDAADVPKSLISVKSDRISRVDDPLFLLESRTMLHVFVPGSDPDIPQFVTLGERPLVLQPGQSPTAAQHFVRWMSRRPPETRAWGRRVLETATGRDPVARALALEISQPPDEQPKISLHEFSATASGLLIWLDVKDPGAQVTGIRVERAAVGINLELPASGQIRALVPMGKAEGPCQVATCSPLWPGANRARGDA